MKLIGLLIALIIFVLLVFFSFKTNWWGLKSKTNTNQEQDVLDLRGEDAVDKANEAKELYENSQKNNSQNVNNY